MSLNDQISDLIERNRADAPPQAFATLAAMFARLEEAGVAAGVPAAGEPAPAATFFAADGTTVQLHELLARGPVVLLFYRGRWCPFCDLTLRAFDAVATEITAAGGTLVAVSPQTLAETAATGTERALTYPLLSDPGNAGARAFGLAWQVQPGVERDLYRAFGSHVDRANGDESWELPAPAAFVIDPTGVVRWSWADVDWTKRPEPADVLAAFRSLVAAA